MKKLLIIIVSTFLLSAAFSQSNIRFENRKSTGYFNITQVSFLMGNQSPNERSPISNHSNNRNDFHFSPSITMVNGLMLNEHFAMGIGLGIEMFDRNLFPIFLDVRYTLRDNDVSPFFAVRIGYSIGFRTHHEHLSLNEEPWSISDAYFNQNGFKFNPEIGVKIPLSENADVLLSVGYRHQQLRSTVTRPRPRGGLDRNYEFTNSMNRLVFGVAIMFR